jgi:NADPH:quinone reductase-like Zn-dependent oxidoreductase
MTDSKANATSNNTSTGVRSRVLRFHEFGDAGDVLKLETAMVDPPAAQRIRVRVHACGLNPADIALCKGLFKGPLPRGIGLDVSGVVDAIGDGVSDVAVGDRVFGSADYAACPSAGAADYAVMNHWFRVPEGLDMLHAAALSLCTETAFRYIEQLDVKGGQTVLVHGAGTAVGIAAVQMLRLAGARVIATCSAAMAERLRALGASATTTYGDGMAERVLALVDGGRIDRVLDAAPPSGSLPALLRIMNNDPQHIITCSDFAAAGTLGIRTGMSAAMNMKYFVLDRYAKLAAEGKFELPVARTFRLDEWRDAIDALARGRVGSSIGGKIMLLAGTDAQAPSK